MKAKQYLYPSEFQRFVTCDGVPLEWRRAVTLAIYLFPRASELRVLRWEDVDLEHGTVHIHRGRDRNTGEEKSTKGRFARRFAIEPTLLPLLRAMHDESRGHGVVTELWSERNMAAGFRRWLKRAGADRAELHCSTRTRKAIRFHDLRATGLTWMAVRGDDPLKIMQRAGHTDFQTTQLYVREAEAVRDGFGEVFPALPPTLLAAPNRVAYGPNGSGRAPVSLREPIPNDAAQVACAAAEIPESERRPRQPIERNEWPTKRPRRRTIRHLGVRSSTTAVPPDVLNAADLSWTVPSTTASNPALSADQFRGLAPATKGGAQTHSGCTPWRCHERVYPAGPCYSTMTCEVESDSRKES